MKTSSKVGVVAGVAVLAAGVFASVQYTGRSETVVHTGGVVRRNLASIVTATGEIKPRNYINIGANAMGQLTQILVHDGDRVRMGQLLATVDNTQAKADVASQTASLHSAEADTNASRAGLKASEEALATAQAVIDRGKADLERMKNEAERARELLKDKLIARQEYEQKQAAYDAQMASVRESQTRLAQARAQREQAAAQLTGTERRIAQSQAALARTSDILAKYNAFAPIDGVVTNLPVRVGETVVPGVQNSSASLIMTIADMSVITAEVKVDESDIVNVRLEQPVEIAIDAIPNRTFKGRVTEIGNTAILRSTGMAASQSATSSQEAKDFKVVIAVDDPPAEIRPGLSCTVKITTATRQNALAIPIQALTMRQKDELDGKPSTADAAYQTEPQAGSEIQGVFIIAGGKAEFRNVETGITGGNMIEVISGLKEQDRIVTGSYQTIRTLKNGSKVKVDNTKSEG